MGNGPLAFPPIAGDFRQGWQHQGPFVMLNAEGRIRAAASLPNQALGRDDYSHQSARIGAFGSRVALDLAPPFGPFQLVGRQPQRRSSRGNGVVSRVLSHKLRGVDTCLSAFFCSQMGRQGGGGAHQPRRSTDHRSSSIRPKNTVSTGLNPTFCANGCRT